ncbi:hypothetical protein H4Q26_005750 [Puccinia striiformis f. sp. tritici PST-130]|nr:hypothetical protein H4Q26_005750 [Puccinia striiformis f. sp. tritici PST-130]
MNPDGFWSTHAHPELNLKLRVKDLAKMTSQALLVVRPMYHHSRPVDHPQRTSEDQQEPSRTGPTTDYLNRINHELMSYLEPTARRSSRSQSSISSFAPGRRNLHVGSLIASCLSAKLGLLNPVLKRDRGNNVDRISIGLSGKSINGLRKFYDIRSSVAASLSKDTGAETWVNLFSKSVNQHPPRLRKSQQLITLCMLSKYAGPIHLPHITNKPYSP